MSELLAVYQEHLGEWLPQLIDAAGNTVRMTILAFILAFILGLLLALARLSPVAPLRWFASGYIEVLRGIPTLAVLFLIYFGLADFGIIFDAFPAAVLGFGLSGAAYMAEIFRAGIESVHESQRAAARSLGLTSSQTMRFVVAPQAIPPDVVTMYAQFVIHDERTDQRQTLVLCYPADAEPAKGFISVLSPAGLGLIGLPVGAQARWAGPGGEETVARIEAILFQPEATGDYLT